MKIGLILEGGGMRACFSTGVVDYWMERGLYFQDVYAVSAGACLACSYLCHQPGRGIRVWTKYIHDPRYCSVKSLVTTGDLFGAAWNYDIVPRQLEPLDDDVFLKSGARFTAVVTDVDTGEPVYLPIRDMFEDIGAIQASASLPLISNMVKYQGGLYLDGGIADSIPVKRAISEGFEKNVLVLTQAAGYQKQPNKAMGLMKLRYGRYPQLLEAVKRRHIMYNDTLRFIDEQVKAGKVFIIRPDAPPEVGRVEKDPSKLMRLHDIGYEIAKREYDALMRFIEA